MFYIFGAVAALALAVYVMVTIERLGAHDLWRYALYIAALIAGGAALFGVLHSSTQRIGIVCAVLVLAWRALSNRTKESKQQENA
ncbi:hypothetical protein [Mycobacteroides immunogenum]|nr:hypothetical protein [Mycobacteroides immunogenum]